MLAKSEYSSPPDEVCCWPRRRGDRDAGTGAVVESHREDVAGRGAVAQLNTRRGCWCGHAAGRSWHREAAVRGGQKPAGRSRQECSYSKMLLAGAPWWLSYCWPGDATEQDAADRGAVAQLNTIRGSRCASNVERACCLAARRY